MMTTRCRSYRFRVSPIRLTYRCSPTQLTTHLVSTAAHSDPASARLPVSRLISSVDLPFRSWPHPMTCHLTSCLHDLSSPCSPCHFLTTCQFVTYPIPTTCHVNSISYHFDSATQALTNRLTSHVITFPDVTDKSMHDVSARYRQIKPFPSLRQVTLIRSVPIRQFMSVLSYPLVTDNTCRLFSILVTGPRPPIQLAVDWSGQVLRWQISSYPTCQIHS